MTFSVTASTRKARRKEDRAKKKQNKRAKHSISSSSNENSPSAAVATATKAPSSDNNSNKRNDKVPSSNKPERSPGKKAKRTPPRDVYASLPSEVAAAMKRDDDEIAALGVKLGLGGGASNNNSKQDKTRLNSEYAKNECFGEGFGSFLDDLDTMVARILKPNVAATTAPGEVSSDDEDEKTYKSGSTSESEKVEEHASTE